MRYSSLIFYQTSLLLLKPVKVTNELKNQQNFTFTWHEYKFQSLLSVITFAAKNLNPLHRMTRSVPFLLVNTDATRYPPIVGPIYWTCANIARDLLPDQICSKLAYLPLFRGLHTVYVLICVKVLSPRKMNTSFTVSLIPNLRHSLRQTCCNLSVNLTSIADWLL